ncbi:hypothetical protein JD844_016789 [Phrynosoma platyrhinos]|uniref:Serpin domain-containing protein n=1 Tax=Phrynosoma platyrhinos TaxID=52577 RepID=A0ABQ7SKU4_PHRPL|nr:hypothetical protein JD844_016789 [Phrynosoma platyrhinos]
MKISINTSTSHQESITLSWQCLTIAASPEFLNFIMTTLPEANAKFAIDTYQKLREEHPHENLLFAPVNATSALGLLAMASGKEQAADIEQVLHWDELKESDTPRNRRYLEAVQSFGLFAVSVKTQEKVDICPKPRDRSEKNHLEPTHPRSKHPLESKGYKGNPHSEADPKKQESKLALHPDLTHPEPGQSKPRFHPEREHHESEESQPGDVPHYESGIPEGVHTAFSKILATLNSPSTNCTLTLANKLYGDHAVAFIQDLFPKDSFDCLAQLVQVNALYFNGQWQVKFDKELTVEAPFYPHYAAKNDSQTVQLMNRKGVYNTAIFDIGDTGVQVLEIPYKENELSLVVLLPTDCSPEALEQLEDSLTHEHVLDWSSHVKPSEVDVFIPKFSLEKSLYLNEYVDLHDLSDPEKADFSQATTTEGVSLTQLVHDVFFEINEEGGEEVEAPHWPQNRRPRRESLKFVADHPFLYFVYHNCTQSIVLLGKFAKPA